MRRRFLFSRHNPFVLRGYEMLVNTNLDHRYPFARAYCWAELSAVREFLLPVREDYPGVINWFDDVVLEDARNRAIFTYFAAGRLVGLGIAKKDIGEKKICTLRVDPDFHCKGLGLRLATDLCSWLETDRPLITVSEKKIACFTPLFQKLGWSVTSIAADLYQENVHEYFYNEKSSNIV